jgi:hypothetical protein
METIIGLLMYFPLQAEFKLATVKNNTEIVVKIIPVGAIVTLFSVLFQLFLL